MSTHIAISLEKRRKGQDGTFMIVYRLGHFRKTTVIASGFRVLEKDWDAKRRQVRKTHKGILSVSRINQQLLNQKALYLERIEQLKQANQLKGLTAIELKELLTRKRDSNSFFEFTERIIQELRKAQKFGNARNYDTVLGVLRTYQNQFGKEDLSFEDITYRFLVKFEHAHLEKGNSINGLSVYMRAIRALYNKAIKEGLSKREDYPFAEYKIRSKPTQKRAITVDEIRSILSLELEEDSHLFHYRNYFIASYMLWGISFMDLAFLRMSNISNGRISYRRRKTEKVYDIPISDQLAEIIAYYAEEKKEEEFIFPIIKREKLEDQYRDIKWARKRYNKGLREIGEQCGIEEKMTSYVARHSFATQALLNEIPIKAISEMLGHNNLSTTQVYLKSLPSQVLDDYSKQITLL